MTLDYANLSNFWQLITRLGEMQILIPAALLALLSLFRRAESRPLAIWWLVAVVLSTVATTASKIAFIGWGIGIAELDFTGISGHAMFAAAVYPFLFGAITSRLTQSTQRFAIAAGFALAFLVAYSRLMVGAHSGSEVVAGLLLGGAVSASALICNSLPRVGISPLISAVAVVWLLIAPVQAPQSQAHSLVIKLSLLLSKHEIPHTRISMLQGLRGL